MANTAVAQDCRKKLNKKKALAKRNFTFSSWVYKIDVTQVICIFFYESVNRCICIWLKRKQTIKTWFFTVLILFYCFWFLVFFFEKKPKQHAHDSAKNYIDSNKLQTVSLNTV